MDKLGVRGQDDVGIPRRNKMQGLERSVACRTLACKKGSTRVEENESGQGCLRQNLHVVPVNPTGPSTVKRRCLASGYSVGNVRGYQEKPATIDIRGAEEGVRLAKLSSKSEPGFRRT